VSTNRINECLRACSIYLFLSMNGLAQSGAPAEPPNSANTGLEEIVVTATKREENLNRVGETVQAFTADTLRDLHVSSPADVTNLVPGLTYAATENNTPVYTLRGVGYFEASLAAYPAVTVYADEMPFPFMALAKHAVYDLDQIEVLKGPQGTVFGQNSTGGAINYIQAKPTKSFDAGASVTYGRFNEIQTEAFVSGPLTDNLQARLTLRDEHEEGWQQSNSRPGDTNGKVNNTMGRLQVAYQPTDNARFLLNVNASKDNTQPQAPQFLAFYIQDPVASPLLLSQKLSPMNDRAADWIPGEPWGDTTTYQTSLRGDIDIVSGITLTSLTSYISYQQRQRESWDGLPIPDSDPDPDDGSINSFYQELRFANSSSESTRWILGGNYGRSRVDQNTQTIASDSSTNATLGLLGFPYTGVTGYSLQTMRNVAGFANIEQDVLPNVTLKAGARYTDSEATNTSCITGSNPGQNLLGNFFYDVTYGGKFGPYYQGRCYANNNTGQTIGGIAPNTPGQFNDSQDENNVSWLIGADWRVEPELLLYTNIAKGYKAGDFAALFSSSFVSYLPVKQESILSYEVGVKSTMLDHRLQANAAAFYYDYTDKQVHTKIVDPLFGVIDSIQNIPKSTVSGAELELTARPVEELTIGLAFTYTHAYIDQFVGINAAGVEANFAGAQMPYTPRYQADLNLNYTHALTGKLNGFAGAQVNQRSGTVAVIGGDVNPAGATPKSVCLFCINGYTTVDMQVGAATKDDHWRMSVWGKNIFDKYYWNNVNVSQDSIARYTGMPATFGITVNYRYR